MESDLQRHHHNFHNHQNQHQQNQMNSGLTRYHSAPSSYFSSIIDREFSEQFFNRPSSPETERIFARFMTSGGTDDDVSEVEAKEANRQQLPQFMAPVNNEEAAVLQQQSNYVSASQNFYQSPSRQPLPNQGLYSSVEAGSYTMGMDRILPQMKMGVGNNSSLVRHSSLPVGSFSHINAENSTYLLYLPIYCLVLGKYERTEKKRKYLQQVMANFFFFFCFFFSLFYIFIFCFA